MTINHYENFPVASILLPAKLRPAVRTIYHFARSADDFADEGDLTDNERLRLLENYESELSTIEAGARPSMQLFQDLAQIIAQYEIPTPLFRDLLSAFKQDITTKRYQNADQLFDYCRRSANPVGRIMLCLFRTKTETQLRQSDQICTALQIINFWQDVAIDLNKGRIYIPQSDLEQFAIDDFDKAARTNSPEWQQLMQFEVKRARQMMLQGAPLAKSLRGRFGIELRMVVQGGLRILEKIEDVQYDVFNHRPRITKRDVPVMCWRSLTM